ncbi:MULTISPECIES: D-erythronate dehydrogenase [Brucella]|uniref:3-beta hydroxysteroid dehydrogenase/isomerase family protein n=1 Tax=Brucella pseudogrignonensis TaxID=419475 RepID=A0A256GAG2_9HYPH|nr:MULTISPECIES: D-erythronate dehydrogenase [Brucella]OYR23926.1 3-beta hydroxysteroid dehydrogenase/isomerase family protein [Brucella pseudogrignonensis]
MHVLIIGAAGMVGRKLTQAIAAVPAIDGMPVERLTLVDVVAPQAPIGFDGNVTCKSADISDPRIAPALIADRPDLIFHLAAIVSGEAEVAFEKGYAINLDGTRFLLEAIRQQGEIASYRPRLVFTSSIAVFGAPFPDRINDEFFLTPRTSYGTQKAIGELLLADYARKGLLDAIGIRLPTVCIRPGTPNKAASGFFSNILREPLIGKEAILPVADTVRHWHVSPRRAVGFLLHAATIDTARLGHRCVLNMPGLSATVGEQIEALRRVAGDRAVALIRKEHDPLIASIVDGWAQDFDAARALELGFVADSSFDEIINIHIEDELKGELKEGVN